MKRFTKQQIGNFISFSPILIGGLVALGLYFYVGIHRHGLIYTLLAFIGAVIFVAIIIAIVWFGDWYSRQ